jgi:diguanylate cyclase (GGDEF)-like protein
MFQFSIKTKLSVGISLILLVAFIAINLLNYNVSRASLRENIINDALPGISNDIFYEIQRDLIVPIQVSSLMAHDTFLKDWVLSGEKDKSKIIKYLWEIKERYHFFSTFLVSSQTNHYYHFKGLHKTISPEDTHDVWYYHFIGMGVDYVLDVDTDEASRGALTIFINHRLNDYQGNLIGVTGVGLKMSDIGRLLHSYQERYHKEIYLVDRDGLVQIHSDQELIKKMNIQYQKGIGDIAGFLLSDTVTSVTHEYNDHNRHKLVLSRYIPEFDWFLIVEHTEGEDLQKLRKTFISNLIIGITVTFLVIVINVLMVNHFQGKLEDMATTDELTALPNRRFFFTQAKREMAQCLRSGKWVTLLMIDIDLFKKVNDTYGHGVGDRVLTETASRLKDALREGDLAGRIGGEEFAVLLPATELDSALKVAERLRRTISRFPMYFGNKSCTITISIGIASDNEQEGNLENLMIKADKALFESKKRGRNRVCTSDERSS